MTKRQRTLRNVDQSTIDNAIRIEQEVNDDKESGGIQFRQMRLLLARLSSVADTVRSFFALERKTTLPLESVIDKVAYSGELTPEDSERLVLALQNLAPKWIRIVRLGDNGDDNDQNDNGKHAIDSRYVRLNCVRFAEALRLFAAFRHADAPIDETLASALLTANDQLLVVAKKKSNLKEQHGQ
jgi:DNA replication factor Cdt1 C-terminal domain